MNEWNRKEGVGSASSLSRLVVVAGNFGMLSILIKGILVSIVRPLKLKARAL